MSLINGWGYNGGGEGNRTLVSFFAERVEREQCWRAFGDANARFFRSQQGQGIHGYEQQIEARLTDKPADWN